MQTYDSSPQQWAPYTYEKGYNVMFLGQFLLHAIEIVRFQIQINGQSTCLTDQSRPSCQLLPVSLYLYRALVANILNFAAQEAELLFLI